MIERELKSITEQTLRELVTERVGEGKTLEFKRVLDVSNDEAKLKFLRGVVSFANASGGDMVFGVAADKDGKAEKLVALENFNPDRDVLRLRDITRMNIEPRSVIVEFMPVGLSAGGYLLVMRIRKSWAGAHFVTYNGDLKFFTRDHGGRRPMDVPEIRNAFTGAENITEKINRFRLERLGKIVAGETPCPMESGATIVIHIFPLQSFEPGFECNLSTLRSAPNKLAPLNANGWSHSDDFDGFFTYAGSSSETTSGYSLVFRNGCLESTDTKILSPRNEKTFFPSVAYEQRILEAIPDWTHLLKSMGVEAPALLMLSFLGVNGYWMYVDARYAWHGARTINRDQLIIPAAWLETLEIEKAGRTTATNIFDLMRPMFNAVWNACGYPHSFNFDTKGNWNPAR